MNSLSALTSVSTRLHLFPFLLHRSWFFACHMVIFVTSNLRPNLSPSNNKIRTLTAGGGNGGGKWFASAKSILLLPSLLRGQGSDRVGATGTAESSVPQPGKEPPGKFSRSLGLPTGSEPEMWVQGNLSSLAQRLAAVSSAWQKMTAAFRLRALIPWQGWTSSTPGRGVRGTRETPAPQPITPPA